MFQFTYFKVQRCFWIFPLVILINITLSRPTTAASQPPDSDYFREKYLDIYYWMEALSRAPLILAEKAYGEKPLTDEDLKRIYNLSFTASHLIDPIYFKLRNAYYSSRYQDGAPFDIDSLDSTISQQHQLYLDKLHKMHKKMSPYFTNHSYIGKTFKEFNTDIIIPSYKESYIAFKQWMVQYDIESKPYNPTLGETRAKQWIKYEIAYTLAAKLKPLTEQYYYEGYFESCLPNEVLNKSNSTCLNNLLFAPLKELESQFMKYITPESLYPVPQDFFIKTKNTDHVNPHTLVAMFKKTSAIRENNQPPYGMAFFPVKFSQNTLLVNTGLSLYSFSTLSLESLETLKIDIRKRRKTAAKQAVIPEIAAIPAYR